MTTYTIGSYTNVAYCEYAQSDNSFAILYNSSHESIGQIYNDSYYVTEWQEMLDNETLGMFIYPFKEYEYWSKDHDNGVWVIDYDLFTPMLEETMKKWRNSKLGQVMQEGSIYFVNTPEERTTMLRLSEDLKSRGVDASVNWKGSPVDPNKRVKYLEDGYTLNPNYDPNHPDAKHRWATGKWEDFQNAGVNGSLVEQNAFSTEKYIIVDVHGVTPYEDLITPVSDAEDYFDNL